MENLCVSLSGNISKMNEMPFDTLGYVVNLQKNPGEFSSKKAVPTYL